MSQLHPGQFSSSSPDHHSAGLDYQRTPGGRWSWSTHAWLTIGVCVAMTVLGTLGLIGAWLLNLSTATGNHLVGKSLPAQTAAIRLENALVNQETGVRGYGLTGRTDFLQPYSDGRLEQQAALDTLRPLIADDPVAVANLRAVMDRVVVWQTQTAVPVASSPPGVPPQIAAARAAAGKAQFDDLRGALAAQQRQLHTVAESAGAERRRVLTLRNEVFSVIAAVIAALCVLVFVGLRRGVTQPLARLSASVRQVADGDFNRPISVGGPSDIHALGSDVEAMRSRLASTLAESDEAAARLDAQAQDLRRSNEELEQFAYVASHDLQEPLRKVASFCQLLQKRYGSQLDERADQYIGFAVDGAQRMQALISDLLTFSRVGRVMTDREPVDLEETLADAVDALAVAVEESGAEITHDPLPLVDGDRARLGMLLSNLIGNAVKFRRPELTPRIHVSAYRDAALWRFAVSDNGIGIEPEYADKVFVIFQRLHTREAYPGTGIGLAMCKKIVEFHGGTIAVDRGHRPGTRITFTLPVTGGWQDHNQDQGHSTASEAEG